MSRKKPTALGAKLAGVLMHDLVKPGKKKLYGIGEIGEYKPSLSLTHRRIPELKNRKPGDTIKMIVQGIINSVDLHQDRDGENRDQSSVEIDKIGVA